MQFLVNCQKRLYMIKATFKNIQSTLLELVSSSKSSIQISVAWFTNKELMGRLIDKIAEGVNVEIIISDDVNNKRLSPKEFLIKGGNLMILNSRSGKFLHEKFAVFDSKTLISGSYNWTYSAEYHNHESLIITDDSTLIKQFEIRFKNLKEEVELYESNLLVNETFAGADLIEQEYANLELELENDLIKALDESKKLHAKVNFDFVLKFIKSYGGIGAGKRLMNTGLDKIQSGFLKMWELGRMDLTFESIISKPKYKDLFDERTISIALERLNKFKK